MYIYLTAPYKFVKYKMEIVKIGYSHQDDYAIDQADCWLDKNAYQAGVETAKLSRFKLVETFADEHFPLEELRLHGLTRLLQRSFTIDGSVLEYLQNG